jgi:hypothetical protein
MKLRLSLNRPERLYNRLYATFGIVITMLFEFCTLALAPVDLNSYTHHRLCIEEVRSLSDDSTLPIALGMLLNSVGSPVKSARTLIG